MGGAWRSVCQDRTKDGRSRWKEQFVQRQGLEGAGREHQTDGAPCPRLGRRRGEAGLQEERGAAGEAGLTAPERARVERQACVTV